VLTKTFCLAAQVILVSALLFYYPKWGVAPNPNYFFAHEGLFFKGIREFASLGSLTKTVIKKVKKFPRQSAALTRRQRLKSVQGFHFS
jgi:hypothetical protein